MRSRNPEIPLSETHAATQVFQETKWHQRLVSEKNVVIRSFWNVISFLGRVLTLGKWNPLATANLSPAVIAPAVTPASFPMRKSNSEESTEYEIMSENERASISIISRSSDYHIFVKSLRGKAVELDVDINDTTEIITKKLAMKIGTPKTSRACHLVFAGKRLEEGRTLGDYNIQKESTLHQVIRLN